MIHTRHEGDIDKIEIAFPACVIEAERIYSGLVGKLPNVDG